MSIRYLESADHVKASIEASMKYTPSTSKALEIASCVTQGLRFFDSAKSSQMEIKPLLCFYGMSAFAKALILSRTKNSLNTLKGAHGFSDITPDNAKISEMKLKINSSGTFTEFNNVASEIECVTIYEKTTDIDLFIPTSQSEALENLEITIDDIWSRSTFLGRAYKTTFQQAPKNIHFSVDSHYIEEEVKRVKIIKNTTVDTIEDVKSLVGKVRSDIPALKQLCFIRSDCDGAATTLLFANFLPDDQEFNRLNSGNSSGAFEYNNGYGRFKFSDKHPLIPISTALPPLAGGVSLSEQRYVNPINDQYISEWSYLYMGCFLLSSFCRYRPDDWMHTIQSRITPIRPLDNKALYLIDLYLDYALKEFPEYISNAINVKLPETGNQIERPRENIWL